MRKLLLALLVVLSMLGLGGAAVAKTVTVTITKAGYVANAVKIAQGDTVQFTNSDAVAHQVTFKTTTGVVCTPTSLVLQPGANGSCTFKAAGAYSYSDPNAKGNTYRGSVTVTAPPESVTLVSKPMLVVYGGNVAPSGSHSTQVAGDNVDLLAQPCGASAATKLLTVQTTAGGLFVSTAHPLVNTAYTAKTKNVTSNAVAVRVRPKLLLARVTAHRYALRVTSAQSFAAKYASFQRYNATLRRWVAVRTVRLVPNTTAVAPTVATTASFGSTVTKGLRVRVTLGQAQVGSCYAAGTSNTVLS